MNNLCAIMKLIFMRHAQSEYNAKNLINQDPKIKVKITNYLIE